MTDARDLGGQGRGEGPRCQGEREAAARRCRHHLVVLGEGESRLGFEPDDDTDADERQQDRPPSRMRFARLGWGARRAERHHHHGRPQRKP